MHRYIVKRSRVQWHADRKIAETTNNKLLADVLIAKWDEAALNGKPIYIYIHTYIHTYTHIHNQNNYNRTKSQKGGSQQVKDRP